MASSWNADQVLALAPDGASAKAGQGLGSPGKWASLGSSEGVLWGECQGSGANPYQTKVELGEPAFSCSCPSRKFPCKHGLGLFLIHVQQPAAIVAGEPPAWVTSWLEGRAKRAEQKAEKERTDQEKRERGEPTADAPARRKREAARAAKVAAGLDELGLWLGDLMRQGLAAAQGRPSDFWEERARRMIDAQAPGVARRLSRIEMLPSSGEGWQDTLLEHLGRLHLLLEGHRRLVSLPPEVQADVRVAVGYPVDQDEVRSGPGVRDTWAVVGQRVLPDIQDPRLRVQRTWLIGHATGRTALVLDFAHGNQPLDTSLVPGTSLDAELAFFPGNVPLRALVKQRQGTPESLTPLNGQTIAQALATYAEALARNVWLDVHTFVLENVLIEPRELAWIVRDASGAALPVSSRFERGWHLLALGGGRPLTLAGEFDGEGFEPLSAFVAGRFRVLARESAEARPAGPPVSSEPSLLATWRDAAACALIGLDRRQPAPAPAEDGLHRLFKGLDANEPSRRLLAIAAASSLYGRAGRKPAIDPAPPHDPCGREDRPECGPASARRLRSLLDGKFPELLPEWLGLLASSGRRVPDELLVDALDSSRPGPVVRDALRPGLGTRGRWLAAMNPAWRLIGGHADRADPAVVWQSGAKAERQLALKTLRRADPERGRELLLSTWSAESADDRRAFLEALAIGLTMADEPFLESALDDRGKLVRVEAADLLVRLPESRLSRRMSERARSLLRWDGRSLAVELPAECDAGMIRDGVRPKPIERLGERAWWLREVLTATPLSTWTEGGATPEQLVASIRGGDWTDLLWTAWANAAIRERKPDWAAALLEHMPDKDSASRESGFVTPLLEIVLPRKRDAFLLRALQSDPGPLHARHPAAELLGDNHAPLSGDLASEVLRRLRALVDSEIEALGRWQSGDLSQMLTAPTMDLATRDHDTYQFLIDVGRTLPIELAEEAGHDWPAEKLPGQFYGLAYQELLDRLRFRHEMHQEFAR